MARRSERDRHERYRILRFRDRSRTGRKRKKRRSPGETSR